MLEASQARTREVTKSTLVASWAILADLAQDERGDLLRRATMRSSVNRMAELAQLVVGMDSPPGAEVEPSEHTSMMRWLLMRAERVEDASDRSGEGYQAKVSTTRGSLAPHPCLFECRELVSMRKRESIVPLRSA